MSIVGRRGSSGSGWTWPRPPLGPPRRPPGPPLLPLAGAGLFALLVILALLGVWLAADSDGDAPNAAADTPTPVLLTAVVSSPIPSATPMETPVATPRETPMPTPTPTLTSVPPPTTTATPTSDASRFRLAVWDGRGLQFDAPPRGAAYQEGEAIPILLRIDSALPGIAHTLTIGYGCEGFDLLTTYDRDTGSEPALASGGPGNAIADSSIQIPDGPGAAAGGEAGSLSLWGGSFVSIGAPLPSSPCTGVNSLSVSLLAAADTLFLMWAAQLSDAASDSDLLLRLAVQLPGGDELSVEIDPASIAPAQP